MRKNQKNESSFDSNSRNRNNPTSQRMQSGRNREFDTDADLRRGNENYYRNEGRQSYSPRSDYEFEQNDRSRFSSPMDMTGRYESDTRNSRDYTGNFPSAELSGLGPGETSYGRSEAYALGAHAGKGPKGYQRSEERIREDVCEALAAHTHIDASEIEVEVSDGMVTLSGTVESRQTKRLAEQAVERVRGVKDIHNQLQISSSQEIERDSSGFAASKAKSAKSSKKSSANYRQ
ncbi:hypothetical protein CIK05_07490 [Bdellovibrio sp. qaytius]|nr:hypothetical protein CIK05_07490 [Bdellovibrio sp. qaytius]